MTQNDEIQPNAPKTNFLESLVKTSSNVWNKLPLGSFKIPLILAGFFSVISPFVLGSIYAFKHGLPVLEVIDALEKHGFTIILISFLITLVLAFYPIAPGLMRFNDPYLVDDKEKEEDKKNFKDLHSHNVFRIGASLLPSVVITGFLFYLTIQTSDVTYKNPEIIGFFASFGLAAFGACYMNLKYSRLCKKLNREYARPYIPSTTTLIDVAFISLWIYLILQGVLQTHASFLQKIEEPILIGIVVFLILAASLFIAFLFTVWAAHKNTKSIIITPAVVIIILLFIYPGASQLVTNHLKMMSQGGGVLVVMSTDDQLIEEWPELFPIPETKTDKKIKRRTQVLSLTLLTDSKVFVKLPENAPQSTCYKNSQIEFARERVKSIAFIGKRDVPLKSTNRPVKTCSPTPYSALETQEDQLKQNPKKE
ncbi:hypothetical protein KFE96_04290 [Kordiimonas sp. SCSIO 12603]|uniref:hypothetical protein n=1 Tax=Kordiimonas sp. SCSIO 12603 TaxID=2829596 RepID=UPI00210397B4|nr:hypothetical protein [Kordiimonas sp. SCSIO 12603]UTW59531.1 hypothetical protein KFE96_04290 [Kordiimonas sp. SCSIO 12603]